MESGKSKKRWRLAAAVALVLLAPPFYIATRSFAAEYSSFTAAPRRVVARTWRERLPSHQEVSWKSGQHTIRGSFVPGVNRAALILLHGSGGNRTDLLAEAELFSRRGFSVLAFDWPGHGESDGRVEWGDAERAALRASIDWLFERPEIDHDRVGALGISMGGVPLIQEGAREPRLRAIGVASTPGDLESFARWEYRRFGPLSQWPAMLAMSLRGMRLSRDIPTELIGDISPRPVLVVVCSKDDVVPPLLTRALYEKAREPKELLELPSVSHGEYTSAPSVYPEHILSFYSHALLAVERAQ